MLKYLKEMKCDDKVFGKVNSSFPQVSVGWPGWPWMFWFGTTFLGDWQSEKKKEKRRNT